MSKFTLTGGRVITPMRVIENGMVTAENGVITYVGPYDAAKVTGDVLDVCGQYVSPGWIDIHSHGGGGHDFMDGTEEAFFGALAMHASHGTATMLPTSLSCSDEELIALFELFRKVKDAPRKGADTPGLHLEGPFFCQTYRGAQDPRYVIPPTKEHVEKLLSAGEGLILRWSAAPELPGGMEFGRLMRDHGIVAAVAHSEATDRVVCEAIENGYSLITHLYCAQSGLIRINSYRYPGVIESGFFYDEIASEIIADGCHLPANILRHCYRSIGTNRLALITDSMRGAGMPEGESLLGSLKDGQKCIIEDGVAKMPDRQAFAGSVATADRMVRNMRDLAGAPITDAVKMITLTPAKMVGLKKKGMLAPGMDADFTVFDENINVSRTISAGETVYEA